MHACANGLRRCNLNQVEWLRLIFVNCNCTLMTHLRFFWQNPTDTGSKSANKRPRRSSGQTKAVEGFRVISEGSDLTLLINSPKDGGIVYALQPILVPEIVARCGMRWWNAHCNPVVKCVLREVVVKHNLGHFGPVYDKLHESSPASLNVVLKALRASHQHTGKSHHERMAALIAKLFRLTKDPAEIMSSPKYLESKTVVPYSAMIIRSYRNSLPKMFQVHMLCFVLCFSSLTASVSCR